MEIGKLYSTTDVYSIGKYMYIKAKLFLSLTLKGKKFSLKNKSKIEIIVMAYKLIMKALQVCIFLLL